MADDPLREMAHQMGRMEGNIEALNRRFDESTRAMMDRLAEHDRNSRDAMAALRQDLVHANTNMRQRIDGIESDVDELKRADHERSGAFKLARFLEKYAGWIASGLIGIVAYLK